MPEFCQRNLRNEMIDLSAAYQIYQFHSCAIRPRRVTLDQS